ncbi:hypothetical protein PPTG_24274 [Phytophthora nicotianae INRA-310]|uniref:Uncharacterized protein n=1 Tax=Phytophthora nicotianae (strain INRA-310) TaxID=761204 RepID=W2PHX3_PHYN3|nr:hypothetical protein PPTG_24274 [Phytophthora nicotianae INRA-310]ETN00467.1 hypothetical protein PPTG_24274 [Phytophthora nicotianae INRA-310]
MMHLDAHFGACNESNAGAVYDDNHGVQRAAVDDHREASGQNLS